MSSILDSIGPEEKKKLEQFIAGALQVFQECADLNGGLKDTAKSLAEEFAVKPAVLMKAARTVFKSSLADDKDKQDTVEEILTITGHA